MEIILYSLLILLAVAVLILLWKYWQQKRDIYNFTQKLDTAISLMLQEKTLESEPYRTDDLWGMIYERILRLSHMYTHKNQEIVEEKETLKELVSDISHQTKTPLANIKLCLEMIEGHINDEEGKSYYTRLTKQVDKLDFLIQSMIKMSRLETGTIKVHKKITPISETLGEAISAVVLKADSKNIQIHVNYDESLLLNHDKKWTSEALVNLLDNAVKYTESGGRIYVSVQRQELFTKISIRDTGKGILPERQGLIFSRFYREPEIHDQEGVGIGLFLAREIVTLQGGYIKVSSEPGRGSDFMLYLPN